jgi:ferredoxin-NADP reductase
MPNKHNILVQLDTVNQNYYLTKLDSNGTPIPCQQIYHFKNPEKNIEHTLKTHPSGEICAIAGSATWENIFELQEKALKNQPLSATQLKLFETTGFYPVPQDPSKKILSPTSLEPLKPHPSDNEIICRCLGIKRITIQSAIKTGCSSFHQLQTATSCATICGTCKPSIIEILGETGWSKATFIKSESLTDNIRLFQFKPNTLKIKPFFPGQHIILKIMLEGFPVERPYTLSSTPGNNYYEIIVKKEPKGALSNWLFDRANHSKSIEISSPQGDYFWNQTDLQVVCLVGGIGITPALSIARSIISQNNPAHCLIYYSILKEQDNILNSKFFTELYHHPNISIKIWNDEIEKNRIPETEISKIAHQYAHAKFYLCGPAMYNDTVKNWLLKNGIAHQNIFIETFIHAKPLS